MSWLDKVVGAVSPERAYKRLAWQMAATELRNYDAGKNDRLNDGWRAYWSESEQMTDRNFRDIIRARERDLERNSDVAG